MTIVDPDDLELIPCDCARDGKPLRGCAHCKGTGDLLSARRVKRVVVLPARKEKRNDRLD